MGSKIGWNTNRGETIYPPDFKNNPAPPENTCSCCSCCAKICAFISRVFTEWNRRSARVQASVSPFRSPSSDSSSSRVPTTISSESPPLDTSIGASFGRTFRDRSLSASHHSDKKTSSGTKPLPQSASLDSLNKDSERALKSGEKAIFPSGSVDSFYEVSDFTGSLRGMERLEHDST
jgi:hypothetical protein